MTENDTNIFLPIFKQDEHANALRQQIIDWTKAQMVRLAQIDVGKLQKDVKVKVETCNKITLLGVNLTIAVILYCFQQKLSQGQRPSSNTQAPQVIPQANIQTVNTNSVSIVYK